MSTPPESIPFLVDWTDDDDSAHWSAIETLLDERGVDATIELARVWIASGDSDRAVAGIDLLGFLARTDPTHLPGLIATADALVGDPDEEARGRVLHALGNADDGSTLPVMLRFVDDESPEVRMALAAWITQHLDFDDPSPEDPVLRVLLGLSNDVDPDVRDWAVFGLGTQVELDTPEIRAVLLDHLDDDGADTAGEAAVGLARRKDLRVLDRLTTALASPQVGNLYVEAAAELGDPRLLPLLIALDEGGWRDGEPIPSYLDDAIEACGGDAAREVLV